MVNFSVISAWDAVWSTITAGLNDNTSASFRGDDVVTTRYLPLVSERIIFTGILLTQLAADTAHKAARVGTIHRRQVLSSLSSQGLAILKVDPSQP